MHEVEGRDDYTHNWYMARIKYTHTYTNKIPLRVTHGPSERRGGPAFEFL